MSAFEAIIEDLKALPPKKLAAAAGYINHLKAASESERRLALDQAFGCLSEEEGRAMEDAIQAQCERVDASQW